jgi:hypothetical protein
MNYIVVIQESQDGSDTATAVTGWRTISIIVCQTCFKNYDNNDSLRHGVWKFRVIAKKFFRKLKPFLIEEKESLDFWGGI